MIRLAKAADLPALVELYAAMDPINANPYDPRTAFDAINGLPGSTVLVFTDTCITATLTLFILPNLTRAARPFGLVENVVTHPNYRNKGQAQALLADAITRAKMAGCYKLMLLSGSKDPAAEALYTKAGFDQSKTGYQIRL